MTDSLNGVITYGYDETGGNVTIDPDTGTMTSMAGSFGTLTSVASQQGTIHYVYDVVSGRKVETWTNTPTDAAARVTDTLYGYDSQGRLASVTSALQNGVAPALFPPMRRQCHHRVRLIRYTYESENRSTNEGGWLSLLRNLLYNDKGSSTSIRKSDLSGNLLRWDILKWVLRSTEQIVSV